MDGPQHQTELSKDQAQARLVSFLKQKGKTQRIGINRKLDNANNKYERERLELLQKKLLPLIGDVAKVRIETEAWALMFDLEQDDVAVDYEELRELEQHYLEVTRSLTVCKRDLVDVLNRIQAKLYYYRLLEKIEDPGDLPKDLK